MTKGKHSVVYAEVTCSICMADFFEAIEEGICFNNKCISIYICAECIVKCNSCKNGVCDNCSSNCVLCGERRCMECLKELESVEYSVVVCKDCYKLSK